LLDTYIDELQEHEEFRRTVLGSDYGSDGDSDMADPDMVFPVGVEVRDPPVSDVLLSFEDQSQISEVSNGRVAARENAFMAALDSEGSGWHGVAMISTGDNHTVEEAEL
jgi:hypothetical protein